MKKSHSRYGFTLGLGLVLAACTHEKPNFVYMPDMAYSSAYKAQEVGSMRQPVEGTIPRGFRPYPHKGMDADSAGPKLKNPLNPTLANLERGQKMYNTYCTVCHGESGEGDGSIVPKFPRPPSLLSDKVRNWQDGSIFHVISAGQNLMPSYATQITDPRDRWSIALYIRAIQRSKNPTPADLRAFEAAMKE